MVKTIQMKLDVNKTTANNELIRIRQGDKNSTKLEVEVLYNGQPYSLTGLSATFNATKPDGKVVVENATTSENKIIYVLNSQVGAISGTISKAYFSIKNTSGVEIDSTSNFRIDVLAGTDASAGSSDYVDSLESTRLKAQNLLNQIDDSIAAVNGTVAQINTLGQQASNTLKEKLEGLSTQAATGVNEIKERLQELISSKIANIQSQADAKLASIQKDWNTLKPQLQAEINALSTKVSGIDSQSNTIKARLDALVVQLDSIDIVSVKNTADKATADVAELRERKTYLHTAWSNSADGTLDFNPDYKSAVGLDTLNISNWAKNTQMSSSNYKFVSNTDSSFKVTGKGTVGLEVLSKSFPAKIGDKLRFTVSYTNRLAFKLINENGLMFVPSEAYTESYKPTIKIVLPNEITASTEYQLEYTATTNNVWMQLNFGNTADEAQLDFDVKIEVENLTNPVKYAYIGTYTDYTADDPTDPAKYEWIPIPRPSEYNVLKIAQNALDINNLVVRNDSQDVTISKLTKSVNGITPDASGNISLPQPDLSPYATTIAMNTALSSAKSYADTKKSEAQSYTDTKLSGVLKSWTGTQAQYDALTAKDSNTLYIIVEGVV